MPGHATEEWVAPLPQVTISVPPEQLGEFFIILQQGFAIIARTGCSLTGLLCDQLGLGREYVKERITTIFMNGRAIDDLEKAIVSDGATVALSAAMPGLVGATMRRGGYYAAMRGAMTYQPGETGGESGLGTVRIKLFNLLLTELGPGFLAAGIMLPAAVLRTFLAEREETFWHRCGEVRLNAAPIGTDAARQGAALPEEGLACLTVQFKEQP